MGKRKEGDQANGSPPRCSGCNEPLKTIEYRSWGTMRFDAERKVYADDDSPGNADIEYSCPKCSAKVDPEGILF